MELSLCWLEDDEWLGFYDPAAGEYLNNLNQEREALQAERAARAEDQRRIRQLEEQLHRLQSGQ